MRSGLLLASALAARRSSSHPAAHHNIYIGLTQSTGTQRGVPPPKHHACFRCVTLDQWLLRSLLRSRTSRTDIPMQAPTPHLKSFQISRLNPASISTTSKLLRAAPGERAARAANRRSPSYGG